MNPSSPISEHNLSTILLTSCFASHLLEAVCLETSIGVPCLKMTKRQTIQFKNGQRASTDVSPEKLHSLSTNIGKDAQDHWSSGKCHGEVPLNIY